MSPAGSSLRVLACAPRGPSAEALTGLVAPDRGIALLDLVPAPAAPASVARLRPDLLIVALEPDGAGMEAIRAVMGATPVPILAVADRGAEEAAAAIASGALQATGARELGLGAPGGAAAAATRARLRLLAGVPVIRHPGRCAATGPGALRGGAVGIVASTGGPGALALVLARLPADYPLPVLVVQHMTAGLVGGLVEWLDARVALPVRLADGARARVPGVFVAPDGAHLAVGAGLELLRPAADGPHQPSGDVLLASLAHGLGDRATAVVLTGMGRDGAEGLRAVRAAGGLTLAQDEASAAVAGMPRAAAAAGAALTLPPAAIGARLAVLGRAGAARSAPRPGGHYSRTR